MISNPAILAELKAAYKAWHESKGLDTTAWLDLFDDDIVMASVGNEAPATGFAGLRKTRLEAVAYFSALTRDWSMNHWTPYAFVSEGDRIAVFATCNWTFKATGKAVEIQTAHLWQVKGDKLVDLKEVFDSARAVAATMP